MCVFGVGGEWLRHACRQAGKTNSETHLEQRSNTARRLSFINEFHFFFWVEKQASVHTNNNNNREMRKLFAGKPLVGVRMCANVCI